MTEITTKLSDKLKAELIKADEIWVAVGLLNEAGLNFILKSIPKSCTKNFVVGINLPTSPQALSNLLKGKKKSATSIFYNGVFHPKVYIIRYRKKFTAFIGSANCTNGGLKDNIEMTTQTKDQKICNELVNWFEKDLLPNSIPLTFDFIKNYKPIYDNRIKRKSQDKKEIFYLKKIEKRRIQADIKEAASLISELIKQRQNREYENIEKRRQLQIRELRNCIDYPRFTHFDFKTFFTKKGFLRPELGTLPAILVKSSILNNKQKFTKLLKYICNEDILLAKRIDEAMDGEFSIDNIKKAFISKVLITHNPKKYYVHNKLFMGRLKPFGLTTESGLSFGKEYEMTRDILKEKIMKKTNIDDFATLDAIMFEQKIR